MKKLLFTSLFLMAFGFANAQAVADWTLGSPTLNNYNNHLLATDSQGNVYKLGTYNGTSYDFDPGAGVFNMNAVTLNMYLIKFDASGIFVWAKQIGGGSTLGSTSGTSITIDASDNLYVAGSSDSIIAGPIDFDPGVGVTNVTNPTGHYVMYILKLDTNGNLIWNKHFNNPNNTSYDTDKIQALKVDAAGNIYATGCYNGIVDFDPTAAVFNLTSLATGATSTEIFILKLNNAGNLVWAKALQNSSGSSDSKTDTGYAIDVDATGNVYTTGYYTYSLDADPSAAVHNLNINPTLNGVQYISKLDSNGSYVWANDIAGQNNNQFLPSLIIDNANNILITGNSYNVQSNLRDLDFGSGTFYLPYDTGAFVLKINANADFIWAKSTARSTVTATSSQNYGNGMALDAAGSIYTVGLFKNTTDFDPSANVFTLTSAGNYDGYISKLDTNGNFVWANKIGGTGNEILYSVAISPLGKVSVSGSTNAGFARSAAAVTTGGFLASYTQPALATSQFELDKNIAVYPNPTTGAFNIKINDDLVGANATIYNILGQKVNQFKLDALTTNQTLDKGLYLIEIDKDNNKTTRKLIVN